MMNNVSAEILALALHDNVFGHLIGFQDGKNILQFSPNFFHDNHRLTFTLTGMPNFPNSQKWLSTPKITRGRLHPVLSNLLPEGALRELLSLQLRISADNEFQLLKHLGHDLPGAITARSISSNELPAYIQNKFELVLDNKVPIVVENKFSLSGVQMKFSMKAEGQRFTMRSSNMLGDWILKTPSSIHKDVTLNEYTSMKLAEAVSIKVPEIKLVELNVLDNLPPINMPSEQYAYAILRFDRDKAKRVHIEDFAQILQVYPHEKYQGANYQTIAKIIYEFSEEGILDIQEMARRLLVNILLANGDAHLKNWSFIYSDGKTPRLSPAYDILSTMVYFEKEDELALKLAKTKKWYEISLASFEYWAQKGGLPWRAIESTLHETIEKIRDIWPVLLKDLPMNEHHKERLPQHWQRLHSDFKI